MPILDAAEAAIAAGEPLADPGVAFVAALDPLAWDRDLLRRLFGFDYIWEVYVPGPKRRHGLLHAADPVRRPARRPAGPQGGPEGRDAHVLGLWWEDGFDPLSEANPGFVGAFAEALRAHMAFVDARKVALPRVARQREFAAAVRARL